MFESAKKDMGKHGVLVDNVRIDVAKMMAQKATAVSGLTKGIEGLFKKNKVKYVKGAGALTGTPGTVEVTGLDGSTSLHTTKNVILATGSEARRVASVWGGCAALHVCVRARCRVRGCVAARGMRGAVPVLCSRAHGPRRAWPFG
jgi:thioredoxin reductase